MHSTSGRVYEKSSDANKAEVARANEAERAFLRRFRLEPYPLQSRHLWEILSQGNAPSLAVRRVLHEHFINGDHIPFDHGGVYGQEEMACVLIAHPYPANKEPLPISDKDRAILAAIAGLGVATHVGPREESFYGFGTYHIRVGKFPEDQSFPDDQED